MNWYKNYNMQHNFLKLSQYLALHDPSALYEPLKKYLQTKFLEYSPNQLLLFGLSHDEIIESLWKKLLSIKINIDSSGIYPKDKPYGYFSPEQWEIGIGGIDEKKYNQGGRYADYVDSALFHEYVHAINYIKKLYDSIGYDPNLPGGEIYYLDPEEQRAYKAQMKIFLQDFLGIPEHIVYRIMEQYTLDKDQKRKEYLKTINRRAQLQETLPYFEELSEYGDYVPNEEILTKQLQFRGLKLQNEIGRGDSGISYLLSNGDVLKITTNSQEGKIAQYLIENPHPSIVEYKDVWKMGDLYCIIMEYLDQMVSDVPEIKNIFDRLQKIIEKYNCFNPQCSYQIIPKSAFFQSLSNKIKTVILNYLKHLSDIPIPIFDFLNSSNIGIKNGQIKFFDIT